MNVNLFANQSTNASSPAYSHTGGLISISAWGAFGGGTLTIEALMPDGTWVKIDGGDWLGALCKSMQMPPCMIRATLANATAPSVSCSVIVL